MASTPGDFNEQTDVSKNNFIYKWNMLFEKEMKEWIAFKPTLGLHVFPCYSCRHMFYSKKSFLDHVNRRTVVLHYRCFECTDDLTFYNRCSFLLHCRKHYNLDKGVIYLNNLDVKLLPFDLVGIMKHPDIPYLFDVDEDYVGDESFMNAQFYSPRIEDKGKYLVTLVSTDLVINSKNQNGETELLALKQVAKNIPKCQFISLEALREMRVEVKAEPEDSPAEELLAPQVPEEINDTLQIATTDLRRKAAATQIILSEAPRIVPTSDREELLLPVITKVETVIESPTTGKRCSECDCELFDNPVTHFLGDNKPQNELYRCGNCKLICPTECSFKAHLRIHTKTSPHICPDCGIEFLDMQALLVHMDEVCFHMAKSVRYRCPGRRCGKIFASEATFGPHFKAVHIDTLYVCATCRQVFLQLEDCEDHCLTHKDDIANIFKVFSCSCCSEEDMDWQKLKKHLEYHCADLSRCIYIFMCKFCKCYFRSVQTMATHIRNCKVHKTGVPRRIRSTHGANVGVNSKYISSICIACGSKTNYLKTKPIPFCSKCFAPPLSIPFKKSSSVLPGKCVCILCKSQINFMERRKHQNECKYGKPQVLVEKLDIDNIEICSSIHQSSSSSSSSDLDGSPLKHQSDSGDEIHPRKRHKLSKPKKPDAINDLTAEKPITFDGIYECLLCDYKNCIRKDFHEHIKTHRNISTAYQCMECGECFVVKPSLIKHLLHFHNISNYEKYFLENDCFDKGAVLELAKVVKAPHLANNVKDNQCKVCLAQFDCEEEHDKHFRTHGMAFLMKNSI